MNMFPSRLLIAGRSSYLQRGKEDGKEDGQARDHDAQDREIGGAP